MKFDFSNSRYAKLWEDPALTSIILNDPEMIRSNFMYWSECFLVDPNITPTDASGAAVFISRMRQMQTGMMMDMRAPLGDTIPEDNKGVAAYTGVIPDFSAKGTVEQAMEREYKERMFRDNFGNDAFLVAQYTQVLQAKVDSANQTLSNMAAQLNSTGKIVYKHGEGIKANVLKADIPSENFQKAGEKAWTATDCQLLDQMVDIEERMRDSWGVENMALRWDIPYDMFKNVFLKNAQVKDVVKSYLFFQGRPITENMNITETMFMEAVRTFDGLSPIYVVKEKQKDATGVVNGWKSTAAVLRPEGYAGYIRHTSNLDRQMFEKYGSSTISRTFAVSNNGLFTVMNSTLNNGNLKEWHTDLFMSAVPSLDEFLYHVIVDTTQAGTGAIA